MKERGEIIRNKGSGHEIRENCRRVTFFRDQRSCMFMVHPCADIFCYLFEPTGNLIISIKCIVPPTEIVNARCVN